MTTLHKHSHAGIPAEQYDAIDFATSAMSTLCYDMRYSPMERQYLIETRDRLNTILLSPRKEQP